MGFLPRGWNFFRMKFEIVNHNLMQILLDSYIYSDFIPILIQIFDLWIYISDVLFIILIRLFPLRWRRILFLKLLYYYTHSLNFYCSGVLFINYINYYTFETNFSPRFFSPRWRIDAYRREGGARFGHGINSLWFTFARIGGAVSQPSRVSFRARVLRSSFVSVRRIVTTLIPRLN